MGWLEAERGHVGAGAAARWTRRLNVEPNYAFPWVVKGVMAARAGTFAGRGRDVEEGPKASSRRIRIIDQLIAEAEKGRSGQAPVTGLV